MKASEIIAESMRLEQSRILFLEQTRSVDVAYAFARRTCSIYRRAVVRRSAPAGEASFRWRLIGSYCYLKRYLQPLPPDETTTDTYHRTR